MGLNCSIPCGCDQYVNKVFQWLHEKGGYIHNLKKNLSALTKTMEELKAKRDDLSKKLKREEDKGRQKVAQLDLWLNNVKAIEKEVNALLTARNDELQRLCLCEFCSKSLPSSYRYGKSVVLRLREVEKLKKEVFEVLTLEAPTPKVRERPLQPTIVGQEEMLNAAWKDLMEEGTGIMGMYGMGGVGKTTLLTQLNNKFSKEKCEFVVIWILVSREFQIEKIQDAIAHQVRLQWNQEEKMTRLFNHLRQTRFVLLLDDIWEKVELSEIGIPNPTPENRCKVVFTTRNQDVCASMAVNKSMEVKCLAEKDAFVLFEKKVGQETLGSHPEIPDLAKKIAEKCHGLPLVLNMIGETMRSRHQVREWENAIKDLNSNAAKFYDKENKILRLLKYSYDSLKEKDAKLCLQYCALFPKDEKAKKTKLIEYWICEEIIDGSEGIERAEDKGYDIIGSLVRTSLLMNADQQGQELVMMHDVIRKMVLWIVHTELGIQEEAFIVGAGLSGFPKVKNWSVVRRMALMDKKIHHLVGSPKCMELTTLLLQNTLLDNISSEFFKYMPKLVVLDLSDNSFLSELPEEISQLVSLQYLNLANAAICHFPKGVLELKKLIHLDLEGTWSLSSITGISRLQNLKVLKLLYTSFPWDLETMKELGSLKHLEILTTTINPGGEQFLCSDRLMSCTRFLDISGVESSLNRYLESSGISLPVSMDKLRCFSIKFCSISEIKMGNRCSFSSLVEVVIQGCEGLRELTFLMFAPSLRILNVQDAKDLEDIIKTKACEGEESGILPKLNDLSLRNLPKLTNIYWNPLLFPCLEKIYVGMCSNLKKLPLDSKSGRVGCKICYKSSGWINSVEWEDKATRDRFLRSSIKAAYSPS